MHCSTILQLHRKNFVKNIQKYLGLTGKAGFVIFAAHFEKGGATFERAGYDTATDSSSYI